VQDALLSIHSGFAFVYRSPFTVDVIVSLFSFCFLFAFAWFSSLVFLFLFTFGFRFALFFDRRLALGIVLPTEASPLNSRPKTQWKVALSHFRQKAFEKTRHKSAHVTLI
jgi:hypothetical protein